MSKVPCPSCDQPMNAAAIVCPHCGARRAGAEPGLAGKDLSKDEVKAMLAIHGEHQAPSQGILPTLVLPHPTTHGSARAIELACTVIALPLVIVGALSLGLGRRRTRRSAEQTTGEVVPVLAAGGLGGFGLYGVLTFAGLSSATALGVVGVGIAALITRGVVRARATNTRDRDLHQLAKPEPAPKPRPSKPQLPAARVEKTSPVVAVAPARPAEAPRASNGGELPDEPSLLK